MKTRDELLAMAERAIDICDEELARKSPSADGVVALSQFAQACVMLAKERREGVEAIPFVITVEPTVGEMERANKIRRGDGVDGR